MPLPWKQQDASTNKEKEIELNFKINPGDRVWVNDDDDFFKLATVKEQNKVDGTFNVFTDKPPAWNVKKNAIWPINPASMDGVPDNTQLMHLHDPSLLWNVKFRYMRDDIYTFTAYILIAVNPYKQLSVYTDDIIRSYLGKSIGAKPPHVFAVADRAYKQMRVTGKSQSIIVSGESGAGKTETCKFVMRFYAVNAGRGNLSQLDQLESKILEANPILEAFGNAKTLRNNNSSRFGKFTELHFDKNHQVSGASIVTYLLEKSRVVGQAVGERNFHIFYQLVAGTDATEKQKYHLNKSAKDYWYLNNVNDCTTVANIDDVKDYNDVKKFLKAVGISAEALDRLLSVLAGILHLGNVSFEPVTTTAPKEESKVKANAFLQEDQAAKDGDKVQVSSKSVESLQHAAELLGMKVDMLQQCLANRSITVGKSRQKSAENTYTIQLSEQEAKNTRDALAKYIYGSLFNWIVSSINKNIPLGASACFIGILDISGFELFEHNSFEQLCINFANEKIQAYFNEQILNQEQEIYLLEGLAWRTVEFDDNSVDQDFN